MDQVHLYAYETLGHWQIVVGYRIVPDDGEAITGDLYRGTHVAIDEQDPQVRTVLLLDQVVRDLNQAIMGELDTLGPRPMEH